MTITQWKVTNGNDTRYYKNIRTASPEEAANRARTAGLNGKLTVTGLTMHAETKPLFTLEADQDKARESIIVHVSWSRTKQYRIRKRDATRMAAELDRRVRQTQQSGYDNPQILYIEDATQDLYEQIITKQNTCDH